MIQMVRLGDVAHINPRFDKSSLADDVPVSFVQMASVGAADGEINVSIVRPFAEVKKGSYTPFKDGDVLFAKVTPCMENGKMAVARGLKNGVGFGSSEFHVLRPSDKVDANYLYHFVSSQAFRKEAAGHMTGAVGLRRVPAAFLADAQLPLVRLDEQLRIVAEIEKQFSRLGVAVANLHRVKANLKRYKASVLKAAVEGRLVETEASIAQREGRSYETGEQHLQQILEDRRAKWSGKGKYKAPSLASSEGLPALADGWSHVTGGQLFRWSSGVNLPVKKLSGGEVPVYGGNGINGWHADSNISHPTLVIGRVGAGCGNVHLVMRKAWITDNAIYATEVPGSCDLRYLEIVFLIANLNSVAAGSGQPFVNQSILNDTIVPLPPAAEQARIVAEAERHLSIICEVEAEVDTNLQRAQALRQATLGAAFQY